MRHFPLNETTCGCCQGLSRVTPKRIANRPGLDALAYRIGIHADFLQTMLAAVSFTCLPDREICQQKEGAFLGDLLTTRSSNDPAIALMDAWAVVADVLTFYQERIANEGFLRTATERRSLTELARLVGYRPRSGVAASVFLAFELEKNQAVEIPAGTRAQSVPLPGEAMAVFETAEPIFAKDEWSAIKPRLTIPQRITGTNADSLAEIYIQDINTTIQPNDPLLFIFDNGEENEIAVPRWVTHTELEKTADRTKAVLEPEEKSTGKEDAGEEGASTLDGLIDALLKTPAKHPVNAFRMVHEPHLVYKDQDNVRADAYPRLLMAFSPDLKKSLYPAWANTEVVPPSPLKGLVRFRVKVAPFGHNAQTLRNSSEEKYIIGNYYTDSKVLYLDAEYERITPGSWIIIKHPDVENTNPCKIFPIKVEAVRSVSIASHTLSGRVTRLTLDQEWLPFTHSPSLPIIRSTTVYAQSESIDLAQAPLETPVKEDRIELDGLFQELAAGRWLIVTGERDDDALADTSGVLSSELVMLKKVFQGSQQDLPGDTPHTTIQLAGQGLAYSYKRDTVTIYGNVTKATQGETVREVLGSGAAHQRLQTFALKQAPLTFVAASTAAGAVSTLTVRVNNVRWEEADHFFALGPEDRKYITQTTADGQTQVLFGDGTQGALLPTGWENITARYRYGMGGEGNAEAGQISILLRKPTGISKVINPLPAGGGAGAETRDQVRRNAPTAVMALDRLVSERDYADFTRAFAGIAKASAARLWDGYREVIHITIAGIDDCPITEDSDLYLNLRRALHRWGDPLLPIEISVRRRILLIIGARVRVEAAYQWETVAPAIQLALTGELSFENRRLGQDVFLSEAIGAIQGVAGVAYVDLDVLEGVMETRRVEDLRNLANDLKEGQPRDRVPVALDHVKEEVVENELQQVIQPAQIAYLDPELLDASIFLSEINP